MTFFGEQPAWLVAANVGAAVMLVLIFGPLGLPGRIGYLYKVRIPEGDWRRLYSRQSFSEFVAKLGEQGIRTYRRALRWDILFALLLSASLVALIDALLARSLDGDQGLFRWAVWVPAALALCDIAEDSVLLVVTSGKNLVWGEGTPNLRVGCGLVGLARRLTWMKFVFVVLSLLGVSAGAVMLALLGPGS